MLHWVTTSSHLHMMLPVKLSLTMNWESSKDLILLNSASFFKNLTDFNMSIMLCKAELTCWHHTAIHALLSVKQSWLAGIILLLLMLCSVCWHHTVKYLCFTAELVVKKYKKISFADQMLRSTEIKWARKREDTDSA